ncbi:hypothetical protein [Desulfogranum japonicum]|uniref:hypothetical protein n=1 Tax=Desulfogranum japonicum TaxID=231447 RepID=UPI0004110B42|nr:hypothetical protein [Desulfogranum japonicum]
MDITGTQAGITTTSTVSSFTQQKNTNSEASQRTAALFATQDVVEISDEARSRLLNFLGTEEGKKAGLDFNISPEQSSGIAPSGDAEATLAGGTSRAAGSGESEDSSNSDIIEDLEEQIRILQQEIIALLPKAINDEAAKAELKAKQVEISVLSAALLQLETREGWAAEG